MVDITQTKREAGTATEGKTETEHTDTEQALDACPECDGRLEHDEKYGETACIKCGFIVTAGESG